MNGDRDEAPPSSGFVPSGTRSTRSNSVQVSVECPIEPRIAEITFDGREIIQPPISKGEKLYRNACKVDFRKVDIKEPPLDDLVSVGYEESRENRQQRNRPDASTMVWALDGVRQKLRTAFTEISVLHDVLALSKEKKYLKIEPVTCDPVEPRPHFNLHYKKKALSGVASILLGAAERLKRAATAAAAVQKADRDYHVVLIKLRDHWRLKKQGQHVSGDLSYRTIGSSIKGMGQFEIRKNEDDDDKPIEVVIAGDLGGESAVQVDVMASDFPGESRRREQELRSKDVWGKIVTLDNPWHRQLTSAQNSLFCREIIMLMSAEAVNLPDHSLSPIVFSDEIHYTSLSGHSVRVKLVQVPEHEKNVALPSPDFATDLEKISTLTESLILEHSLSFMLLNRMRDLAHPDIPIPGCGPVGLKIYRRKMAIQARDRRVWKQGFTRRTLTAELMSRTGALLMRKRCLRIADNLSSPDVAITVHDCSFCTSWKNANIKITLITPGYDMYHKTNCAFNIVDGRINFVTRDYVRPVASDEIVDCYLLYIEIVRQHAVVFQNLLKTQRFEILHYSPSYNYYAVDDKPQSAGLSTALSYAIVIIAKSADNRWMIKVVCSLRYVYRLYISNMTVSSTVSSAIREQSFVEPAEPFVEIDLNKIIGGPTRLRRISLILGYLMTSPPDTPFLRTPVQDGNNHDLQRKSTSWKKWNAA